MGPEQRSSKKRDKGKIDLSNSPKETEKSREKTYSPSRKKHAKYESEERMGRYGRYKREEYSGRERGRNNKEDNFDKERYRKIREESGNDRKHRNIKDEQIERDRNSYRNSRESERRSQNESWGLKERYPSRGRREQYHNHRAYDDKRDFVVRQRSQKDEYEYGRSGSRRYGNERTRIDENKEKNGEEEEEAKIIEPNFSLSGKLAEEVNITSKGTVLRYTEPPEARKPDLKWRLYVFKDGEAFGEPIPVHRESCYLFGRDRSVADIPTDHPSCSKQHLVLQYRLVEVEDKHSGKKEVVKPYVMDLGSVNGTFLNKEKLEPQRYYELLERDSLIVGLSTRDYVLLHEGSL